MAVEDVMAVLAGTPEIGLLEQGALRILAFSADKRRLRSGEILFRRGERSDGGYVVLEGAVAIGRRSDIVREHNILGPGALIGKVALFVRLQRPATAIAVEATTVLRISPTLMRRVLQEFPSSADRVRAAMRTDLADLSERLGAVGRTLDAIGQPAGAATPRQGAHSGPAERVEQARRSTTAFGERSA